MNSDDSIFNVVKLVQSGGKMSDVIEILLANYIKPRWKDHIPYSDLQRFLMVNFKIPLSQLRDIERWDYLNHEGDMDREEINILFEPWLNNFR